MADFSLKLITPPAVEPVALTDVKLHAHIDHSIQDSILSGWIKSGRILAEDFQRRAYIRQVWEIAFDGFPCMPITIPRPPLIEILSITAYDTTGAATVISIADDIVVDTRSEPGRIDFVDGKTWPAISGRSINALVIQYAAGYGTSASNVPETMGDAIMLYCTARNENRAGEEDFLKAFRNILSPERNYL